MTDSVLFCVFLAEKKKWTMLPVGCFLNGIAWWLKSDAACLHLYFHSFLHDSQPLQFMAETPPCFTDGCKHLVLYLSPVPPLPSTSSFVLHFCPPGSSNLLEHHTAHHGEICQVVS